MTAIRQPAMNAPALPLTRDEFRAQVFARDGGRCVNCGAPGQDAHHIIERRLWPDGGYYLANGATLCGDCHILAERTDLSCEALWERIGVKPAEAPLPPDFDPECQYDKWGNLVLEDGTRLPGRLYADGSVQKILADKRPLFRLDRFKYPKTPHLPWSGGIKGDDRVLADTRHFEGRRVIVMEKMDGENTNIYRDGFHARSITSPSHPSRNWVARLQARLAADIPEGFRLCGENLFAKHSIHYRNLPSFFLLFSVWDGPTCLGWDETLEWCRLFDPELIPCPVLYDGIWDEALTRSLYAPTDALGNEMEGYVVRVADPFHYFDFGKSLAKFVRAGHVQTAHNWRFQPIVPNEMAEMWWP